MELLDIELTPLDVANIKYVLIIASVGVDRSFSQYENFLRPNHRHFTFLNLQDMLFHIVSRITFFTYFFKSFLYYVILVKYYIFRLFVLYISIKISTYLYG